MDVYLINLDRSVERLHQFQRLNSALSASVIRWPAVDGSALDPATLVAEKRIDPAILQNYTPGALGAALSHLGLWERAIDSRVTLTLCEDDAIFNNHFAAAAEATLDKLPPDWDLVLWGWNFDSYLTFRILPGVSACCASFDQNAMRAMIASFQQQQIDLQLFALLRAFGTPCYSVSPKGAEALYRHCLPLRPMPVHFPGLNRTLPNNGLDIMMNAAYPMMKAFISFPPLVIVQNDRASSTIQTGKPLARR